MHKGTCISGKLKREFHVQEYANMANQSFHIIYTATSLNLLGKDSSCKQSRLRLFDLFQFNNTVGHFIHICSYEDQETAPTCVKSIITLVTMSLVYIDMGQLEASKDTCTTDCSDI